MSVREIKQQTISEISGKLSDSVSTVLVDYRGLTVSQITELRKQLRESGVDFKVYKNTSARRATKATELTGLDSFLVGPTAMAFSVHDAIAPAKILAEFGKKNTALEIKAGIIEGKILDVTEIKALAELPSREGLLPMLLSVLQAPIRNFALVTKAVSEQREGIN